VKLLITGAGGQLGSEWIDFCASNNISFVSYTSSELDICDVTQIKHEVEAQKPDVIINCAAYTKVDDAEDYKNLASKINAQAVKEIAGICAENKIKLIHYSTDYVFSGTKDDQQKYPEGYSEEIEADPINSYGLSKWKGEQEIIKSECDYLLIRVSWLCGKHGHNFVKTMLRLGNEKTELSVVNDQLGSPTFTDQVVEQTFKLIQKKKSGIFHLSSDGITSWYDFAREIFKQTKITMELKPVTTNEYPTKAKRPSFSKLSTQKISNVDGIHILHWKDGLKRLLKQL